MDLADALGLGTRELVSFVGAGGKKTAMATLVGNGENRNVSVGYTTTTHMPPPADLPIVVSSPGKLREAVQTQHSPVAIAAEWVDNPDRTAQKVRGYEPEFVDELYDDEMWDWLLVKADGARRREFKAPADHEPAIPSQSSLVVVVASVHAVGKPLDTTVVHRPERVASLTDLGVGERITASAVGTVLASPAGGLKDVPPGADVIVQVNKADTGPEMEVGRDIVRTALRGSDRFSGGLVSSLKTNSYQSVSLSER